MDQTGIVFNVQRFTIHDGPGVRTEFFLKGCPLRCQWCSNPESWALQPQVGVYRTKCIGRRACGACDDSCPQARSSDSPQAGWQASTGQSAATVWSARRNAPPMPSSSGADR